jgi:hypothetical protein
LLALGKPILADQGLQLHYIIVVAKLALHKNCHFRQSKALLLQLHFFADQGSAATIGFVAARS